MKKLLIIFCLTGLLRTNLFSQSNYNWKQFGNESSDFISQPINWDKNDWLKIGLLSASTFLLLETTDELARDAALGDRSFLNSVPIELGRYWGEPITPLLLIGAFYLNSVLLNDNNSSKIAFELGQSTLYTASIVYLLKFSFGRNRPFLDKGAKSFSPLTTIFNSENKSLPSGHTANAFSLSTVLSRNTDVILLKIAAYLPAALTMLSRIYQDKHWMSDVFLGAVLGYFIASWVVEKHTIKKPQNETPMTYPINFRIAF